jgi:transcriptional regulator with XRE-family HTH domain
MTGKHWTEKSFDEFRYAIAFDFVAQVQEVMASRGLSQKDLAMRLELSEGRVSQFLNDPGNLTLKTIVRIARLLGCKATVVLYEDSDAANTRGPVVADVFKTCWEMAQQPRFLSDIDEDRRRDFGGPAGMLEDPEISHTYSSGAVGREPTLVGGKTCSSR